MNPKRLLILIIFSTQFIFAQTYKNPPASVYTSYGEETYELPKNIAVLKKHIESECYSKDLIMILASCDEIKNPQGFVLKKCGKKLSWLFIEDNNKKLISSFTKEEKAVNFFFKKIEHMYKDKYLLAAKVNSKEEYTKISKEIFNTPGVNSISHNLKKVYSKQKTYKIWLDECTLQFSKKYLRKFVK